MKKRECDKSVLRKRYEIWRRLHESGISAKDIADATRFGVRHIRRGIQTAEALRRELSHAVDGQWTQAAQD